MKREDLKDANTDFYLTKFSGRCASPGSQLFSDPGLTRGRKQPACARSSLAPPHGMASLQTLGSRACALRPQPAPSSRSGTSGVRGAVPGRGATVGCRVAARPAGCGNQRGHEGEPGKQQLSRPGGKTAPEDSESAELGAGAGRRGGAGPSPKERVPGPTPSVVWRQLQVKVAPASSPPALLAAHPRSLAALLTPLPSTLLNGQPMWPLLGSPVSIHFLTLSRTGSCCL